MACATIRSARPPGQIICTVGPQLKAGETPVPDASRSTSVGLSYCRHCGKETNSAQDVIDVGGVKYEVSYCAECGIAAGAFRLSRDGKSREGAADNLMLRRLHRPDKK